jgi:very-short-patch-repair endonuclease
MLSFKGNVDYALSKLKSYQQAGLEKIAPSQPLANVSAVTSKSIKYAQSQVIYTQPMFYSPLHTPQNWQIPSKRQEQYQWARYFTDNEPKVGAAISFYSDFSMNGFETQCKDSRIKRFFDNWNKKVNLDKWNKFISRENYMLGDVFPMAEIQCPHCRGMMINTEGERCSHDKAIFRRLVVLNPDWIELQRSQFSDDPVITLLPDEELKRVVFYRQPIEIYERIPKYVQSLIMQQRPIPLSNECVSHIAHMPSPYGPGYGVSMIRRLFKILTYKDKLMTAQWIVAERLILPIRLVKVGDAQRPASQADITDIQQQLAMVSSDPNLTLVTHHAVDYDWVGASGKVLQLSNEYEFINKEILQGVMLNDGLLSGEMGGYQAAAIGAETIIQRIESWRKDLARYIEERLYKPMCAWQGFVDESQTKEFGEELGETIYEVPKVIWNDLNIRDETPQRQLWMQLHDKQIMSSQTLCEKVGLDYDQEVERVRMEVAAQMFGQQQQQGGAGGMGGGGAGGGMDLGLGGAGAGAPPMGGDMGGMGAPPPGGDMGGMGAPPPGGDIGGGAPPAGGAAPAAAAGSSGKILTKSRSKEFQKKSENVMPEEQAMPSGTRLTSIEQVMYKLLLNMEMPFKRFAQYPLGPYKADFAIPAIQLAIECDGDQWHTNPEDLARDRKRDMELSGAGWTVVRFGETELEEKQEAVRMKLAETIHKCWKRALSKQQSMAKISDAQIENLLKSAGAADGKANS